MILFLLPVGAGQAARLQDVRQVELDLGRAARAKCLAGKDGVSARIEIKRVDLAAWGKMGRSVRSGPYEIHFHVEHKRRLVGIADAPGGLVRCRVRKLGARLLLEVGIVGLEDRLRALQRAVVESKVWADDLIVKRADKKTRAMLKRGKFDEAIAYLGKLRPRGNFDEYRLMRTADINLLSGKYPTAFSRYRVLHRKQSNRGTELLAQARTVELAMLIDGAPIPKRWQRRLRTTPGAFGEAARRRVATLLLERRDYAAGLALLDQLPDKENKALVDKILRAHLRRLRWSGDAFGSAMFHIRNRKAIENHADRAEMLMEVGRAYVDLDLPRDAVAALLPGLAAARTPALKERILPLLLAAYMAGDKPYRARQTADFFLGRFPGSARRDRVLALRARLRIQEGDIAGARADLRRLAPGRALPLRKLLALRSGEAVDWNDKTQGAIKALEKNQTSLTGTAEKKR